MKTLVVHGIELLGFYHLGLEKKNTFASRLMVFWWFNPRDPLSYQEAKTVSLLGVFCLKVFFCTFSVSVVGSYYDCYCQFFFFFFNYYHY